MRKLEAMAKEFGTWACYDCGKCTATCPIARAGDKYSPRRHVLATSSGQWQEISGDGNLFHCLTCSLCDQRCPVEINYTQLIQNLREKAYHEGLEPECPHGGALQSMMRIMAKGGTQQDRRGWLTEELKTDPEKGEVFYWTGCTMYYDALFPDLQVTTLNGTRAAVKLMNRLGVTPVVSPEERCCGHDLLWNGDRKNFELLAKHNVELVARSGAKVLVTSCAECLRTWKRDYQFFRKDNPLRILHISEFLAEHLPELKLKANGQQRVTFQDPCRLGRHLGIYDAPREVLAALPGTELVEMRHRGAAATCCAGANWSNCDRFAKQIQVERLREARETETEVLVTACPKCQIHFRCAMNDPRLKDEIEIQMCDVAELVAEALVSKPKKEGT